jgi:hypothetical protein
MNNQIYNIYLNTEVNCLKITNSAGKNTEFVFEIPALMVNANSKLTTFAISHQGTGHGDNIITFKIKDILINNNSYYCNDGSYPTIMTTTFNSVNNVNLGNELLLLKQAINRITIIATDDLTNTTAGINTALKFIIGLKIEDAQQ